MAAPRKATAAPAETEQDTAPVEGEAAPSAEVTVAGLLAQVQHGLLTVIKDAVDPGSGHGVDINLAAQAGAVYTNLFGESR